MLPAMPLRRPFVYLASLRRTGSTMLAQLLSKPPVAFIFREPRLGLGKLRVKETLEPVFMPYGVELMALKAAMRDLPRERAQRKFLDFAEQISPFVEQIGIKEIQHEGAESVSAMFPDMKVVVTVRDPRDIYLSLYHRRKELLTRNRLWFETASLVPYLKREWEAIRGLMDRHDHLVVRYEDLCEDPTTIERIRRFVDSPVEGGGLLGTSRRRDLAKHGGDVATTRVRVYQHERDEVARHNAEFVLSELADYARRFGYEATAPNNS
jgi:hypothetical protein